MADDARFAARPLTVRLAGAPLLTIALLASTARAQELDRPRLEIAVGLGVDVDRNWPDAAHEARPLSIGTGAIVGRCFGLQAAASGMTRIVGSIPSRQRGEVLALARPVGCFAAQPAGWGGRVLRSFAVGAGLGVERLGTGMGATWRGGTPLAAQLDLPLGDALSSTQAGLRIGVRRFIGWRDAELGSQTIGDTAVQVYGAFVVSF